MLYRSTVYHVEFKTPIEKSKRRHFYFSTLTAIYQKFTPEQIGCKVENLYNLKLSGENAYTSKTCTISVGEIIRKKKSKVKE